MTKQYRAKPEVWATVERWCKNDMGAQNCLLELRARVEALETAQRVIALPSSNRTHLGLTQDAPASSDLLVKRVADAIYSNPTSGVREEARAAILAVADWLDQQELHTTATRLRQEVG
jgi:hypothetical protein